MERRFDADSTTDDVLAGCDLSGRLAIVTGASGGLGEGTARALADHGARVVIACRDRAKGEAAAERIRERVPAGALDVQELDLSSLASVRAAAEALLAAHPAIDLLVNNAGVMACPLAHTAEGFEAQFGTNHLGHFLLTCLLASALRAAAPARVVNLSSGGHRFSDVLFDDPDFEARDYDKWTAYGQSKTANVLFTVELDRRMRDAGVRAFAVHPGAIMTDLSRHLVPEDIAAIHARAPGGRLHMKTIPAGAATTCFAATAPELEGRGGLYLEDCGVAEVDDDPRSASGVRSYAVDADAARRLWTLSEQRVGQRFAP